MPKAAKTSAGMLSIGSVFCRRLGVATSIALVAWLASPARSHGALLGLNLGRPDITAGKVKITYDAVNDKFLATGVVQSLDYDGTPPPDYEPPDGILATFRIEADIAGGGVVTGTPGSPSNTSNRLTIYGTAPGRGITTAQTLLQADVIQVGAKEGGSPTIEFRLNNVTGALAADFSAPLGVILSTGGVNFDGHFASDFSNIVIKNGKEVGNGMADIAPEVPEPTSLAAWSIAAISFVALRARRSKRRLANCSGKYSPGCSSSS
jgi:hypothetical protein